MAEWDVFVHVDGEGDAEEAERWPLRLQGELAGLDMRI